MGNIGSSSQYSTLDTYFEWQEAYVEFKFEETPERLRVIAEYHLISPDIFLIQMPNSVVQRILDGEKGYVYVYRRNSQFIGKIKLKPRYWKHTFQEYHPTKYIDYIPKNQHVSGFRFHIRHNTRNIPYALVFYKTS
jgi:hypothetical protein